MTATLPAVFPNSLEPFAAEVRTYFRELPRLLAEGHDRKYVLVKADGVFGIWEHQREAIQAGRIRFPDGGFLAQQIDKRFLDLLGSQFLPPNSNTNGAA